MRWTSFSFSRSFYHYVFITQNLLEIFKYSAKLTDSITLKVISINNRQQHQTNYFINSDFKISISLNSLPVKKFVLLYITHIP